MLKTDNYRKYLAAALSVAVAGSIVVPAAGAQAAGLTDVDQLKGSSDFYTAVTELTSKGVIKGFPDGTYRPYQDVTRGQAAAIIARFLELDKKNSPDPGFLDVKKDHIFYKEIAALYEAKIINGVTKDSFQPEKTITRAEMAKMISNAFGLKANAAAAKKFTDVTPNSWYDGFVGALVDNAITQGKTATTFDPHSNVTRVQFAAFIFRSQKNNPEDIEKPGENPGENPEENPENPENPGEIENPENNDGLAAPGITFVKNNVVGNVVDILDLSEDVPARFDLSKTGAKAGDTLTYQIGSYPAQTVTLTQADINRGYVETVISTDALQNVLGSLLNLNGVLSAGVTGASVPSSAAVPASASAGYATAASLNAQDTITEAAFLDLGGLLGGIVSGITGTVNNLLNVVLNDVLGGVLGGVDGVLGGVLKTVLSGVTSENDAVSRLLNTDKLPGLNLGKNITGNIELLDGVNLEVVNGIVKRVVPGAENDRVEGVVPGIFGGLIEDVLGDVLGGVQGTVGTLIETALTGITNPAQAINALIGSDALIGKVLGNGLTGQVELVDGVLALVKDGKILNVVTGVLDGVLGGAQEVTITAKISNSNGAVAEASAKYQFKITDLLGM